MQQPIAVTNRRSGIAAMALAGLHRMRRLVLGKETDKGLLFRIVLYLILIDTAFIYLSPMLYMVTTMIKDAADLLNPSVIWVPTGASGATLREAWHRLDYWSSLGTSLTLSIVIAVCQTITCAIAGYAFARLEFPFKRMLFFCLLLTFIVPTQVVILPIMIMAGQLGVLKSMVPIILPALFGHGLKGALFVIIYRQFFAVQPKELEEAARMDGAGAFRVFYRVMLPLAKPAIVVVFLFSFVWNWNDAYLPGIYLNGTDHMPLSLGMSVINAEITQRAQEFGPSIFDEPIKMASSFLILLPPLLLYLFTQRLFVEGAERTGLVE